MFGAATGASVATIDAALPQTQCTRCGYADCHAYAGAIAAGGAPVNRCPPGGAEGIRRLADLTGVVVLPLDPACGIEQPLRLATIDEAACIGCRLCLKACPVDAILGGPKALHIVIGAECTGCELCLPVCPVDCISMAAPLTPATGWAAWSNERAERARLRYGARRARLARDGRERTVHIEAVDAAVANDALAETADDAERSATAPTAGRGAASTARSLVDAALARARARAQSAG